MWEDYHLKDYKKDPNPECVALEWSELNIKKGSCKPTKFNISSKPIPRKLIASFQIGRTKQMCDW